MFIGFHVNTRYSCQILIELECSKQIFEKFPSIKFHKNLFSGSRIIPSEQTDRLTDMAKLIVACSHFAKTLKMM